MTQVSNVRIAGKRNLLSAQPALLIYLLPLVLLKHPVLMLCVFAGLFMLHSAFEVARRNWRLEYAADPARANSKRWLATIVATVGLVMAVQYAVLIPPVQSPDESAHIYRAYGLADNDFFVPKNSVENPFNQDVDEGLERFVQGWREKLATKGDERVTPNLASSMNSTSFKGREGRVWNAAAGYFPVLYWPAASGFALAMDASQPVWVGNLWARTFMAIIAIIATALALMISRAGTATIAAVSLLPMTLAQYGSVNFDATTISHGLLVVALLTTSVFDTENPEQIPRWARTGCWLLFTVLIISKPVYIALLLLPTAWIFFKHGNVWAKRPSLREVKNSRVELLMVGAALLLLFGWVAHMSANLVDLRIKDTVSIGARITQAVTSPVELFTILGNTITENGRFYWESAIGIMGWLDTPLPRAFYFQATAFLLMAFVVDAIAVNGLPKKERLLLFISLVGYVVALFLLFWASWTPRNGTFIEGIQGRYFIPVIPLLAYMIGRGSRDLKFLGLSPYWIMLVPVSVFTLVQLFTVPFTLLARYWL